MSYFFSTRSGTTYTVEDTENPQVQLLTGGRFDKQTIYRPEGLIGEGQRFRATFAPDHTNTELGLAGRTIETSPITSIHALSNNYQKRVRQAESLCPTRIQKQTDLEYE